MASGVRIGSSTKSSKWPLKVPGTTSSLRLLSHFETCNTAHKLTACSQSSLEVADPAAARRVAPRRRASWEAHVRGTPNHHGRRALPEFRATECAIFLMCPCLPAPAFGVITTSFAGRMNAMEGRRALGNRAHGAARAGRPSARPSWQEFRRSSTKDMLALRGTRITFTTSLRPTAQTSAMLRALLQAAASSTVSPKAVTTSTAAERRTGTARPQRPMARRAVHPDSCAP